MADLNSLNWQDVQYFLAVFEAGSLTKASASTDVSQPTLGRRIRALELQLGNRLFDRLPGAMRPTKLGQQLARLAADARETFSGFRRLSELQNGEAMTIRLSANMTVSAILADHLRELTADAPDAILDIASTRMTTELGRRESDLAIRMRRMPVKGPILSRRLGRLAFAVYGKRDLVQPKRGAQRRSGLPYIGLTDDRPPPQADWLDRFMQQRSGVLIHRLGEVFLRLRSVKAGNGVSLLPCILADREPDLIRLCDPVPELSEDLYLLVHRDLSHLPQIRSVTARIQALFKQYAAALEGHRKS